MSPTRSATHPGSGLRLLAVSLALAVAVAIAVTACGVSGGEDANEPVDTTTTEAGASTTTEGRTSTTEDRTSTTEDDTTTTTGGDDLDPAIRCQRGPDTTSDDAPAGGVTYETGWAALSWTDDDGELVCHELTLDTDDDNELGDGARDLDLRFVDESGEIALVISVTSTKVAQGPIDAFVRVEDASKAWVDPLHSLCEVEITSIDATSVSGIAGCDTLEAWSGTDDDLTEIGATFSAGT